MKMVLRMKKIYEKSVINLTQSRNERGRTAWNAKGERKHAEAGCQNVAEWGHRVHCKTVGAGSI